ncbi:MAG: nucleotidyltransferase family protein [Rhodospirillaceae bacterium]
MAHVVLNSRTLRLRVFPKPKAKAGRAKRESKTLALFDPPTDDSADTAADKLAEKVAALCLLNRMNADILARAGDLGLRDWWLAAGSLMASVWNLRSGRAANQGIREYELVYFSDDASAEAEEEVRRAASRLFGDLDGTLTVRNQARTHLWYGEEYGIAYPPLTSASEGLLRQPANAITIGMKCTGADFFDVYAPFGLGDVWDMVARPNRALPLAKAYEEMTGRWQLRWPRLVIYPWVDEQEINKQKQ